jgi:hypothetical protein
VSEGVGAAPILVTVERQQNPWDAYVIRGLLESEGIPAIVADEYQIWADWQMSLALGGVKVKVPMSHREHALDVLAAFRHGEFEAALENELQLPSIACPACQSKDIVAAPSPLWGLLVMTMFVILGVFFLPGEREHSCNQCGARVPPLD